MIVVAVIATGEVEEIIWLISRIIIETEGNLRIFYNNR
jgi:hypothetical protein